MISLGYTDLSYHPKTIMNKILGLITNPNFESKTKSFFESEEIDGLFTGNLKFSKLSEQVVKSSQKMVNAHWDLAPGLWT